MTSLVDADMQGICALRDEETDTVLFWYEDLVAVHGDPADAGPDIRFDDAAWETLPTFEQLWDPIPELHELMRDLVAGAGLRAEGLLETAQRMADVEYELRRGREDDNGEADYGGAAGEDGSVGAAAAQGGGVAVPGGSEDGDAVGEVGASVVDADAGKASKVPGRRRPRKAA